MFSLIRVALVAAADSLCRGLDSSSDGVCRQHLSTMGLRDRQASDLTRNLTLEIDNFQNLLDIPSASRCYTKLR